MTQSEFGRLMVVAGAFFVGLGLLVWSGALAWFGRLPGDFRIERETVRVYFPFGSMLVISVALSLLFSMARRFF
jgi:hypothetical protein